VDVLAQVAVEAGKIAQSAGGEEAGDD